MVQGVLKNSKMLKDVQMLKIANEHEPSAFNCFHWVLQLF